MAIELTEEIREHVNGALEAGNPMILASVDSAGRPRLSFRGSTQVFSANQLGFWARNVEGSTLDSIGANPNVALMYRHPAQRAMLQFTGRARVVEGAERERARMISLLSSSKRPTRGERAWPWSLTSTRSKGP